MCFSLSRISLISFLLFPLVFAAQDDPAKVKFGKVSDADRALLTVPTDSTADAYVLYDLLDMQVTLDTEGTPILKEHRHRRVKLLRESAFGMADVELIVHNTRQDLGGLKAVVHLPSGESIKMSRRDFLQEDYDDDLKVTKFTFPNVIPGAIIEYEYDKYDEGIAIPSQFYFQEDIPVRWAEYRSSVPEYYNYLSLGNALNAPVRENRVENRPFGNKSVKHVVRRWAYRDLPAYDIQPYVNNFQDYLPRVRFQLQFVAYPNQPVQEVFTTWEEVTKNMDEWENFGRLHRNKINYGKAWKAAEPLLAGKESAAAKAATLYGFVAGRISWNNDYSWSSDRTPNRVYEAAEGSSGEMSMLLLALLKEAGLEAYPVLVPLRDRGSPVELYPMITQFDHLMVVAVIDGKPVLMDPNGIHRPPGLPRFSALNHRAFVANPANPQWINVSVPLSSQVVMAKVVLDEEGMGTVSLQTQQKNYFATTGRDLIDAMEEDSELPIVEDVVEAFPEAELLGHQILEEEKVSGPLKMEMEMTVPLGQAMDDYLYVQPVLCPVLEKGLADVEERRYPVDFGFPWRQQYVTSIKIPSGYVVDELPESTRIKSEDGNLVCTFAATETGTGDISINFSVSVKKTVYRPEEYTMLREMFRRIIDLQESMIVLKRAK